MVFLIVFFFFKQKTAYEMRISDWSSDVCSSDLPGPDPIDWLRVLPPRLQLLRRMHENFCRRGSKRLFQELDDFTQQGGERSEEHTSELQSLMRISYAVFCLKKKKQTSEHQSLIIRS